MKRRTRPSVNELARARIASLFTLARDSFPTHPISAHRYVEIARKMAMKTNMRIPVEFRRQYCKFCYHYLHPGVNARIRTREGKVVITCWDCRKITRIPFTKRKKN